MPGTAEGARKALEARMAKRAARAQQPPNDATSGTMAVERSDVGHVANVGCIVAHSGQTVGEQAVTAILPDAAEHVRDVVTGKRRVSAATRANVALEVLKLASKPKALPPGQSPGMAEAVALLGRALGRAPRTLDGAAVVVPDDA